MARFVTEKTHENINQGSHPCLHYSLLIIIVMEFIRLPDVPSVGVPPIYLMSGLFLFFIILFDLKKLSTISPIIIKIIFLLLFYNIYAYLLAWGLDIQNEKDVDIHLLGISIKNFIQLLAFSIACTNLVELKRVTFTITITITVSAVFGLLSYYFGGFFEEINAWLWQSRADLISMYAEGKGGKGQFVTGLSGTHWLFGYLMTAGPALALICWRLSYFKWLWAVIFILMCCALYLNGERAAFFSSCLAIIALLIHWRFITIPSTCLITAFVLSIYILGSGNIQTAHIYVRSDKEITLLDRINNSTKGDSDSRFALWKAGATSVIESPWIGPTQQEYSNAFFKTKSIVVNNPDRRIPFIHNSYINPGVFIGVIGWGVVLFYLFMLKEVLTQVFTAVTENKQEEIIFQGVSITLLAPMLNAMFQNGSIFSGESANVCLTGLLISCYQIIYKQNTVKPNYHDSKNKYA